MSEPVVTHFRWVVPEDERTTTADTDTPDKDTTE